LPRAAALARVGDASDSERATSLVLYPAFKPQFSCRRRSGDNGALLMDDGVALSESAPNMAKGLPLAAAFARVGDTSANVPLRRRRSASIAEASCSKRLGEVLVSLQRAAASSYDSSVKSANGLPRAAALARVGDASESADKVLL
jgi:hypothetical protein